MEALFRKAGWVFITIFFLMIAWATSTLDDTQYIANLPLWARSQNSEIILRNESSAALDSLTLVLNGVYSLEQVKIAPNSSIFLPLTNFKDRQGASFPLEEKPNKLEVYYNGNGEPYRGGYFEHTFE